MADNPEEPKPRENGWDHLPVDLKLRCLEGLSFKDIFGVRTYCKFDRALIDEAFEFNFNYVILEKDHLKFQVSEVSKDDEIPRIEDEKYEVYFNSANMTKVASILAYILQNFKVEELIYKESDQIFNDEFQKLLDSKKSINVKNLKFFHSKDLFQLNPFFLLEKLRGNFEKAELDLDNDVVNMNRLFMIPAVIAAGIWTFSNVDIRQFVFLVENCAKHLMKVGTVIKTTTCLGAELRMLKRETQTTRVLSLSASLVSLNCCISAPSSALRSSAPTDQVLIPTKHEDRQIFVASHEEHLLAFVIAPGTDTENLLKDFKLAEDVEKSKNAIAESARRLAEDAAAWNQKLEAKRAEKDREEARFVRELSAEQRRAFQRI